MKCLTMAAVLLGALAAPGLAEEPGDAPDHGVARISLLSGDVSVRRGDSGETIAAERNAPLVARDHVITERGARAEIQFDWANLLRIAPESEVRIAELDDRNYLIQIAEGMVTVRVLRDSDADFEISTPTASIRPREKGTYRIEVLPDYSTQITVRSGEADVFSGRDSETLRSGRALTVSSDPANPQRTFVAALPRDDWDRWNESRDRDFERGDGYKYVHRDVYGVDDLHDHGRWVYDPPYGWVWAPHVADGWAPYRVGRWSWVDYYGWTWISGDPWGWAPYHYGRWYYGPRFGWVWYPGDVAPRHYWRPALVAFFGWGSPGGISVGFSYGNVGWVALAPREIYRPWYGRSRDTFVVNSVTVVNRINVVNTYRNANVSRGRDAVTSVTAGDFGRRGVSTRNFVRANDRDLGRAGDVRDRVPFEPSRESRRFSDRDATARNASRPSADRQYVTRPGRENRQGIDQSRPSRVADPRQGAANPRPERDRVVQAPEPQTPARNPRVETPRSETSNREGERNPAARTRQAPSGPEAAPTGRERDRVVQTPETQAAARNPRAESFRSEPSNRDAERSQAARNRPVPSSTFRASEDRRSAPAVMDRTPRERPAPSSTFRASEDRRSAPAVMDRAPRDRPAPRVEQPRVEQPRMQQRAPAPSPGVSARSSSSSNEPSKTRENSSGRSGGRDRDRR